MQKVWTGNVYVRATLAFVAVGRDDGLIGRLSADEKSALCDAVGRWRAGIDPLITARSEDSAVYRTLSDALMLQADSWSDGDGASPAARDLGRRVFALFDDTFAGFRQEEHGNPRVSIADLIDAAAEIAEAIGPEATFLAELLRRDAAAYRRL